MSVPSQSGNLLHNKLCTNVEKRTFLCCYIHVYVVAGRVLVHPSTQPPLPLPGYTTGVLDRDCLLTLGTHAHRGLQYLVCHSVRPSVCYHVFCHYAQQGSQKAIPTGSVPHWLDFKKGDFRKSTVFKSYGVKTKRTSQYANEHGLPRPDSARFEHGGGSRSNTKGEYVVLVCQKHYLPT